MIIRLQHMMHIMYLSLSMSTSTIIILSLSIKMIPTLLPLPLIIFKTQDIQGVLTPHMKHSAQAMKTILTRLHSVKISALVEVLASATVSPSLSVPLVE